MEPWILSGSLTRTKYGGIGFILEDSGICVWKMMKPWNGRGAVYSFTKYGTRDYHHWYPAPEASQEHFSQGWLSGL